MRRYWTSWRGSEFAVVMMYLVRSIAMTVASLGMVVLKMLVGYAGDPVRPASPSSDPVAAGRSH